MSFVTFGDWGEVIENQQKVARAMGDFCKNNECEFVLTLGDNFYEFGVSGVDDPQWETKYRQIYGPLGLPFYPTMGAHDVWGNSQAQIDYAAIDPSWRMEGYYYSVAKPNVEAPLVEIFLFTSHSYGIQAAQWLERVIPASTARWKILAMNVPIISNRPHGDDERSINDSLLPLICNKIDLVLSGHAHFFAHLREDLGNCPIEQLIVGTGGANLAEPDVADPRTLATIAHYGFGWLEVTAGTLTFKMVLNDGRVFYQTSWKK